MATVIEAHEPIIVMTRVFAAPPALVFRAWTDPAMMARWWGPHRFTNPVCELDARPGGKWRIVMQGPDGVGHPAIGTFREVTPPSRLVLTIDHSELSAEWHDRVNPNRDRSAGVPKMETIATVTFEAEGAGTMLTLQLRLESLAVRDGLVKIGMNEGWSQSLERLGDLVATADREIVTTRLFDAPRELVWKAWTEPDQIVQWWGPSGFSTTMKTMDVRPGGAWEFTMHGPDGRDYKNENRYIEVVHPERLVYDHVSVPKFRATATFDPEGAKTSVTLRMVFATADERENVVRTFGAIEGARQTFQRLAEHLAHQS